MKAPQFLKSDNIFLHMGLIVVTAVVVWGLTCGLWSLSGDAETTFAGMAKTMLYDGNFIQGAVEAAEQQAPLALWLSAGALKIAGDISLGSIALRLISVVFALITLWCTYLCGRRLLNPRAGLYGAFILATMPAFMLAAAKAGPDMLFAGLITLSITAIVTHPPCKRVSILRAVVIWLCLIAAFLTYGPLAVIMTLLFIILFAIAHGKEVAHEFRALRFFSGILTGIVVVAVWLFMEYHFTGGTFVKQEFQQLKTLFSNGINLAGWWYYLAHAGGIMGIWTIGLLVAIAMLLTHKAKFIPKWYVWLFWFAPGFVILCLAHIIKNNDFVLPLLPPLALFIGYYLSALGGKVMNGPISGFIAIIAGKIIMILGIVLCTACLIVFIQLEFAWKYAFYISQQGLVIAFIIGLLLIFMGTWQYKTECGTLIGAIIFVLLLGNIGLNAVVRPALDVTQSPKYFSQNLQNMYPELTNYGLGAVQAENGLNTAAAGLHVYGDYKILPLSFSPDMFANESTPALPDFILMARTDFDSLAVKPQLGGFAAVFWDTVAQQFDLILLQRQAAVVTGPKAPAPLIYTVPKPLLLASSAEAYIPVATEETETENALTEEHEAMLKKIYGGDSDEETSATTAPEEVDAGKLEAQDIENTKKINTDGVPDTPTHADSVENAAQPDTETFDDFDATKPVNEPAAINDPQPETEPVAVDTASAENVNTAEEETVEVSLPLAPENMDTQAESAPSATTTETNAIEETGTPTISIPANDTNTPAVLPQILENDETRPVLPPKTTEDNAAVNEPQARQWHLSLVSTAHAEEIQQFAIAENNDADSDTKAESTEKSPAYTQAQNLSQNTPAISHTLTAEPGFAQNTLTAVNLNSAQCILPQGFMLVNNTLTPYKSSCGGRNAALVAVKTYQPNLVRFFSVNLQNGFKDNAYALHWFKTQADRFAAEYNMLIINNLPVTLETQAPYTANFNRWAMAQLKDAVKPQIVFFTGHDPALPQVADSIFELSGTEAADVDFNIAHKVQIDFGLMHTTLLLEYENVPPQVIELMLEQFTF